jgi:hypothetical protein
MKIIWGAALAFAACSLNTIANAETWSCDYKIIEKTFTQKWSIANGRMTAPNGKGYFRVTLNDDRFLIAFHKFRRPSMDDPVLLLVIIEKKTGAYLDIDTAVMSNMGKAYDDISEPNVETGHCTLLER